MPAIPTIGVVCDLLEDQWFSMDLVSDMLCQYLSLYHSRDVAVLKLLPTMRRRATRLPMIGNQRAAFNLDRWLYCFNDYPRWLRQQNLRCELFHIADQSYSQLIRGLPKGRSIVSCHDLDAFRCIIDPASDPRGIVFRELTRHILGGFIQAAHVICGTTFVRRELISYNLVSADTVSVIRYGVHPSCSAEAVPSCDATAATLLDGSMPFILHVGSTIPRKRIELLLRVFATVRRQFAAYHLVRVGGDFSKRQLKLVEQLELGHSLRVLPFVEREVLSGLYRAATITLVTSRAEGFGLPVIESLACGCPVIASDIPVMREVGGGAITYCSGENPGEWAEEVVRLIQEKISDVGRWNVRKQLGIAHAEQFSWLDAAEATVAVYRKVLGNGAARENLR